jgi:hypothetical protein
MIVTEAVIPEPADAVAEPTVEAKSKDVTELVKTTFFFEMGFKNIGEERKAPGTEQDIKTTANKALLKVKKRLFVSPEFQKIKSVDAQFKRLVGKLCVRGGLLTVRTIPKHRAKLILSMCAEHELKRSALVDKFAIVYPALYETAKTELGPLFQTADYPKPEYVKDAFKFSYNFVTYGVPEELKEFDGEGYRVQVEKKYQLYKTAADDINRVRRAVFSTLLGKLQNDLSPGEAGGKKTFHKKALTAMQKFLAEYDLNNVTNDEDLAKLKTQIANLLNGITDENVKSSEDFRSTLFTQVAAISEALQPLIEGSDGKRALKVVQ